MKLFLAHLWISLGEIFVICGTYCNKKAEELINQIQE